MAKSDKLLVQYVSTLKEDESIELVRQRLSSGEDPLKIVNDCQEGMKLVGDQYNEGRYFIAGLIMAGEILRQVMELISPVLQLQSFSRVEDDSGTIVLGTVQEDIHDLGKNIVKMLLSCHGFTVHDLGVDVPPEQFVEAVVEIKPDIIGLSGLISASYESMKTTINLLRRKTDKWPHKPYIIIGGSQIDAQISEIIGADYWVNEADAGVSLCKKLLSAGK